MTHLASSPAQPVPGQPASGQPSVGTTATPEAPTGGPAAEAGAGAGTAATHAWRALAGIAVAALGTGALLALTLAIGQQHAHDLGRYALYQAAALAVAALVVIAVRLLTRAPWPAMGALRAPSRRMPLLGVAAGESWRKVGLTFLVIVSAVTATFLAVGSWPQLALLDGRAWGLALLVALPLSATNALTEELVTRWVVVASCAGRWARVAPWVSAAIFGAVHWFGIPGGPIGALMAGFLAWLLARSIQDTRGIGWAWLIHFCQDVIIFTVTIALFL